MSSFVAMNDAPELLRCMRVMRGSRYCDVIIWCQRQKFFAHRAVLAAASRQFATILEELPEEESRFPVIIMNEAHPDVLGALFDMIYGEEIHIKREHVFHFLSLCENMDIEFRGTGGEEVYGGLPSAPAKKRVVNFDGPERQQRPRPPARCIPDIVSQEHAIESHVHSSWIGQLEGSGVRVYFCDICKFVTKSDASMRDHLISAHPVFDSDSLSTLRVTSVKSLGAAKPGSEVLPKPHVEAPEVISRDWSVVKLDGTENIWTGASVEDWSRTVYYCGKCFSYWSEYKDRAIDHENSACSNKKRSKWRKPERKETESSSSTTSRTYPYAELTPQVGSTLSAPVPESDEGFLCECGKRFAKKGGLLIHRGRFCKSKESSSMSRTVDLSLFDLSPTVMLERLSPSKLRSYVPESDSEETVASRQHLDEDAKPIKKSKDELPSAPLPSPVTSVDSVPKITSPVPSKKASDTKALSLIPERVAGFLPPPPCGALKKEIVAQRGKLKVVVRSEQIANQEYFNHVFIQTDAPSLPSSSRASTSSMNGVGNGVVKTEKQPVQEVKGAAGDHTCDTRETLVRHSSDCPLHRGTKPAYKRRPGVFSLPASLPMSPPGSPGPSRKWNGHFGAEPDSDDDLLPVGSHHLCPFHTTVESMENCAGSQPGQPSTSQRMSNGVSGNSKDVKNGHVCKADRAVPGVTVVKRPVGRPRKSLPEPPRGRPKKMRMSLIGPVEGSSEESGDASYARVSTSMPNECFFPILDEN